MENWVQWLSEELEQNKTGNKVLIVESYRDGNQLMERLARRGCQLLNLRLATLEDLVQEELSRWQRQTPVAWLDGGTAWYWMRSLLQELQANDQLRYYGQVVLSPGMISAMVEAVAELRRGCVTADVLLPDIFINEAKAADMKRLLDRWETLLETEGMADGLRVWQWLQENRMPREGTIHYYLAPRSPLSQLENALLTVLFRDEEAPLLTGPMWEEQLPAAELQLSHSGSSWQEVRDLLRRIKSGRIPLDDCLVLLPVKEPYITYLEALACHYELPMTFGQGTGVGYTRPGKLFWLLLKWIQSDYQVPVFCAMLREGLVQLPSEAPASGILEFLLKKHQVGWGRERYISMLSKAGEEARSRQADETGTLENAASLFRNMMGLLPAAGEGEEPLPGNWINGLQKWWDTYARVANSADGEAKAGLGMVLETAVHYYNPSATVVMVLEELRMHGSGLRVEAREPEPGKVHCDMLNHGLFSPRPQVFIPGLSARLFPGSPVDGPILLDRERETLGTLRLAREAPLLREEQLHQVLTGAAKTFYFSMPGFDPLEHREESPSSFFLQMYRLQSDNPAADYQALRTALNREKPMGDILPVRDEDLLDRWEQKLAYARQWPSQAPALTTHLNEWIRRGKLARQIRRNGTLNSYNGLVQVEPGEVDPRLNPSLMLSASQLEQLAKCPFVHFLQRLLNLYPEEEVIFQSDQWLNALDRGTLLHSVYEHYYREILSGEKAGEALLMRKLLEQVEIFRRMIPPPSERVFEKEVEELTDSCRVFYRSEQNLHDGQTPAYLELKFGLREIHPDLGEIPPVRIPLAEGGSFQFRGSVDRIDRLGEETYEIIDYKTGSTYGYPDSRPFDEGRRLQHALYALVTEDILRKKAGEPGARVVKASYYFPTLKGRGEKTTYEQTPELRLSLQQVLTCLLDAVAAGVFVDWGSGYDRKWEDYRPILQQNPDEVTTKAMLEALAVEKNEEKVRTALANLLEVKCHG